MGLYHFFWKGQERTVAVFKSASKLTLTFVDEEIANEGVQKISISAGQTLSQLLQEHSTREQQKIKEILVAIQQKVVLEPFV